MDSLKLRVSRELGHQIQLLKSLPISTESVETVCLALGPYRNLTTLTASFLALHPHCQVLNHAGLRIFNTRRLNFLAKFSERRLRRFIQFAILASQSGESGRQGGSIAYSHAFKRERMRAAYLSRYGDERVKPDIRCLFWKESLRTANLIRSHRVDLGALFQATPVVRFLMPVRNPLDCATSNQNRIHVKLFAGLEQGASIRDVLAAVLREIQWTLHRQREHPDRIFVYYENEFDRSTVEAIATFLRLEQDAQWIDNVLNTFVIDSTYDHPPELVEYYRSAVIEMFDDFPAAKDTLLAFA
jgi:hypothetical protein